MIRKQAAGESSLLPDYLRPGLDVVFVGAAPSHWAADVGHYYAGPTNRFWLLLYQSEFTPRLLRTEEDHTLPDYGIGLTGLFKDRSTNANHLLPPPTRDQREELAAKLLTAAPRFIEYNGKDVYAMCTGRVCTDWGEQEERMGDARIFVAHSSSARADLWAQERLALYRELKQLVTPT